jgi:hypothetical protein
VRFETFQLCRAPVFTSNFTATFVTTPLMKSNCPTAIP